MDIINAKIQADLSVCSIKEGLYQLRKSVKDNIFLLVAENHNFADIIKFAKEMNFPYENIDTSCILETDTWLLIDRINKRMYYSEGIKTKIGHKLSTSYSRF